MKVKVLTMIAAGTLCLVGTGSAVALDAPMRPYLAESLNYTFADSSRHSENGLGGYFGGGFPLSQYFNIELGASYTHFNDDSKSDSQPWREFLEQGGAQFFFSRNPAFSPYIGVNVGHATEVLTHHGGKDSALFTDVGVGVIHYFKIFDGDFGVRVGAAYRWVFNDDDKFPGRDNDNFSSGDVKNFGEPVISLGLVIPIGFSQPAEEEELPAPRPASIEAPARTPAPLSAGPNRRYEDVHFAFDQSVLGSYAESSLDQDADSISKLLGAYPNLTVDLSGHTDWIGTDAYNQALSERRANTVRDYLSRKGIRSTSIQIHAYGESKPIAPNTTKAGRALNRRVEIKTMAP